MILCSVFGENVRKFDCAKTLRVDKAMGEGVKSASEGEVKGRGGGGGVRILDKVVFVSTA